MRKTKTVNETIIRREECREDGYTYSYELIMKESGRVASYRIPLYSVRVKMTDRDGIESESEIKDAFADAGRAIVFFEKVVRNLATPIDLAYILEDEIVK